MRGRKKKENAKRKTITIRIKEEEYETYKNNKEIREDIKKMVNDYLNIFRM